MSERVGAPGGTESSDDSPLEVLVNLTWLVPGVVGGSEESTTDALRAVLEYHPAVRLTLAVLRTFEAAHPDLAQACRCEVLDLDGSGKVSRVLAEQRWLASVTNRARPDVVHHAGGVVPLVHPGRVVLTIHDLQPLDLPENFALPKRIYSRVMTGRSARAAQIVCVPSEFTASRVIARLGVDPSKVRVVPWSSPHADSTVTNRWKRGEVASFLYPAITYPHKNHLELLDGFALLLEQVPDARLVLPGGPGPLEAEVLARMSQPDLRGRVTRPGRVTADELDGLYAGATAVVMPSEYEGFGLPALEAMARGVPVLSSEAGSLPEVVIEGALVPLADGPRAWAQAMSRVAEMAPDVRTRIVSEQRQKAATFHARRTADALAGAYRDAAVVGSR